MDVQKLPCCLLDQRNLERRKPKTVSGQNIKHGIITGIPLYTGRCAQQHNRLHVKVGCQEFAEGVVLSLTLSYLVTAYDRSHPIQLTPSSGDIWAKRDADTLIPTNFISTTFLHIKVDLLVYLVPIQVIPVGPSKGAAVLLSIQPPTVNSLKHRLRL
jgi:hypothetical protein